MASLSIRIVQSVRGQVSTIFVLALLGALAWWGHSHGWKLPKLRELLGNSSEAEKEDWCAAHNVPDSRCIACHPELGGGDAKDWCKEHGVPESKCTVCHPEILTKGVAADWCREHGVPESGCVQCHPEIAVKGTLPSADTPKVSLNPSAKPPKNPQTCQTHNLRVQFASAEAVRKAGVRLAPVLERPMAAHLTANAETEYVQGRYARLSSRVSGIVRQVDKKVGDPVKSGEVVAVIDSLEVGRAKADFRRAAADVSALKAAVDSARRLSEAAMLSQLVELQVQYRNAQRDLEAARALAENYRRAADSVTKTERLRAEQELSKAQVSFDGQRARFAAVGVGPALLDRRGDGQPPEMMELIRDAPAETLAKMQSLGKPEVVLERTQALLQRENELARLRRELLLFGFPTAEIEGLTREGASPPSTAKGAPVDGQTAIAAPFEGVVVSVDTVPGETAEASKPLLTVADVSRMWVTLDVRLEDVGRVQKDQPVNFRTDGTNEDAAEGKVSWISTEVNEKTRTVRVRAEVENPDGRLKANSFGTARVTIRRTSKAIVVPDEAVHWEGCCHIVFVRLTDDIFQTRKVRLGSKANGMTEIVIGVLPGEVVAAAGSYVLKSEILKSSLGAGCTDD